MKKSPKKFEINKKEILEEKPFSFLNAANKLISDLVPRTQEIIKKRFGIGQKETETLEKIGQEYKITRERVRQIIVDALKKIDKKKDTKIFQEAENKIIFTIEENHGIIEENKLLNKLAKDKQQEINAILFLGYCYPKIEQFEEKGKIKKAWITNKAVIEKVKKLREAVENLFNKEKKLLTDSDLLTRIKSQFEDFVHEEILNLSEVLAQISKNKFGKWGLTHWKEINPKGTRERIYLVLKEKKTPLHFTQIAELIDKYKLGKKKSHPQTVHNELIKDERFVLIGRGIYALSEWGYSQGTVRDVLGEVLSKVGRPMHRDEIVKKVLELRKVKRSTIMINLNNSKYFLKNQNNLYTVKR